MPLRTLSLFIGTAFLFQSLSAPAQSGNPVWTAGRPPKIDPGASEVVQCPDALPSLYFPADRANENFSIYVPKGFEPAAQGTHYGVIVFISPSDGASFPGRWKPTLDARHVFLIAPAKVGNAQTYQRRIGMALVSAQLMQKYFPVIDPGKVYIAGDSGGGRIASIAALNYPEVFHGTIQSCGTDFYKPVSRVAVTDKDLADNIGRDEGRTYGLCTCPAPDKAKDQVRFVLITGPGDFRHDYILDIFHGGYEANGFRARLLDVPGMGHEECSAQTLEEALTFIEGPIARAGG